MKEGRGGSGRNREAVGRERRNLGKEGLIGCVRKGGAAGEGEEQLWSKEIRNGKGKMREAVCEGKKN